jgi:hypothetical protein
MNIRQPSREERITIEQIAESYGYHVERKSDSMRLSRHGIISEHGSTPIDIFLSRDDNRSLALGPQWTLSTKVAGGLFETPDSLEEWTDRITKAGAICHFITQLLRIGD